MGFKQGEKICMVTLRHANEMYFEKGNDRFFGVKKRKILKSAKLGYPVMIERHELDFTGSSSLSIRFTVREIEENYVLGRPESFDTKSDLFEYVGKEFKI